MLLDAISLLLFHLRLRYAAAFFFICLFSHCYDDAMPDAASFLHCQKQSCRYGYGAAGLMHDFASMLDAATLLMMPLPRRR